MNPKMGNATSDECSDDKDANAESASDATASEESSEDEDDKFKVTQIRGRRKRKGKVQYLVKRECCSSKDLWEPEENLDCYNLIQQYENNRSREKKTKSCAELQNKWSARSNSCSSAHTNPKTNSLSRFSTNFNTMSNTNSILDRANIRKRSSSVSQSASRGRTKVAKRSASPRTPSASPQKKRRVTKSANESEPSISVPKARLSRLDAGVEVEEVLGISNVNGTLVFLVKYKDCQQPELLSADDAYEKIPQIILKFYEGRLKWTTD